MPRLKRADQVEALRRQRAEIDTRLREAEEAEKRERRELDQRRDMLAGQAALALVANNPESDFARQLRDILSKRTKRATDRALFPFLSPTEVAEPVATPPTGEPPATP